MSGSKPTSFASSAGSSVGASHTPTFPRADNASRRWRQTASGTITGASVGIDASASTSRSSVQRSSTIARSLMSCGILAFLERFDAQAAHRVDEAFVLVPPLDEHVDQPFHDIGHLLCRERRADDLAERSLHALVTADRNLVPLLAVLIDTEHADVAHMVMTAGIHAARNIERDVAEVVQVVEIVEASLDRLGD